MLRMVGKARALARKTWVDDSQRWANEWAGSLFLFYFLVFSSCWTISVLLRLLIAHAQIARGQRRDVGTPRLGQSPPPGKELSVAENRREHSRPLLALRYDGAL